MPGVMPLVDFFIWVETTKGNKKTYNLVLMMPRAQMSLNELLMKNEIKLSLKSINSIVNQLVFAVKSCNKHNIFHRDIKAANILINFDKNDNTVMTYLSDFGEAILIDQGVKTISTKMANKTKTIRGTPIYLAPELK
jgi:serine/threonine protein kinase